MFHVDLLDVVAVFAIIDIAARTEIKSLYGQEGEFGAKSGNPTCRGKRKCLSSAEVQSKLTIDRAISWETIKSEDHPNRAWSLLTTAGE